MLVPGYHFLIVSVASSNSVVGKISIQASSLFVLLYCLFAGVGLLPLLGSKIELLGPVISVGFCDQCPVVFLLCFCF